MTPALYISTTPQAHAQHTHFNVLQHGFQGRANVTFLRKLIEHQKVDYGHRSDHLECPVDVPCLILSHNSSILSSDVQVSILEISFFKLCPGGSRALCTKMPVITVSKVEDERRILGNLDAKEKRTTRSR
jgi:hypothetical protein